MNQWLYRIAAFLSRPLGFYLTTVLLIVGTVAILWTGTDPITYLLSVAAIVITGIVLIEGDRNTAALHAKLDELILRSDAHNELIGMEKREPEQIKQIVEKIEMEAGHSEQLSKVELEDDAPEG